MLCVNVGLTPGLGNTVPTLGGLGVIPPGNIPPTNPGMLTSALTSVGVTGCTPSGSSTAGIFIAASAGP